MKVLPELYQQNFSNLFVNGVIITEEKMGLYVLTFCRREYGTAAVSFRGPKLDMLNYSSTYTPRVSFVEENPFASDKSPLKLVAITVQREALPTGRLSQALEHVKCCKNNAYDQFEQLTPPNYIAQPYDQNATSDRS